MSNKGQPSVYEKDLEQYVAEQETNVRDAIQRNPTLAAETDDLNVGYKFYLETCEYILNGIHKDVYDTRAAMSEIIQNDYRLNSDYVTLMRNIIEDSIEMKAKIEQLEQRQLEQRLANLRKNGGSRKSYRKRKTIKNKSRK